MQLVHYQQKQRFVQSQRTMHLFHVIIIIFSYDYIVVAQNNRDQHKGTLLSKLNNNTCYWKTVDPPGSMRSYDMCLRGNDDLLSNYIKIHGAWNECNTLLPYWKTKTFVESKDDVFVDAGANIGSCSLLMAANDIKTFSFEPQPNNLLYFRKSLNRANFRKHITLNEYGLGSVAGIHKFFYEGNNQGNSVIDKFVPDFNSTVTGGSYSIRIKTLDEVFSDNKKIIRLMKMDVQGYEMKLLRGAKKLLKSNLIKMVSFELAQKWLMAQGTSSKELCQFFLDAGFALEINQGPVDADWCDKNGFNIVDVLARLK
jgi:FkbM family methyltransferase